MKSTPPGGSDPLAQQAELRQLGQYAVLGVIRRGSMGTLYRGVDARTQRTVALKVAAREGAGGADGEGLSARLRVEVEVAGRLHHPGIVTIHEYAEEAGNAFAVMEYVEGSSLQECFESGMEFSLARSIDILSQVLEALQYAHDQGVWHRDIKPSNILIGRGDRVKLTDFGIARAPVGPPEHLDDILGTPGYIAPETYLDDTFDARVDVFAAGAVLYQLLTGVPAFAGTAGEVMFKVCHETPLPPSMVTGVAAIEPFDVPVMKALQRRPEARFATAAQFREALLALRRAP